MLSIISGTGPAQQVSVKFYANLGKSEMGALAVIRRASAETSKNHTWEFEWKSPNSLRLIKARQVMGKFMSKLIIFFDIKGGGSP
jgi:hypothetical protein